METDAEKRARFNHAATRKIRKLSGWNVFLKQQVQGESLDMGDYTRRVKDASKLWKTMSQDDKEAFEVEANHQEKLRGELAQQPLSAGHAAKAPTALEKAVGHNSCKLLSARRLKLNDEQFDCHSVWDLATCMCDSAFSGIYYFPGCYNFFFTVLSAQCFGYVVRVCHANKACLNTVTVRLVEQTRTVG